MRILDALGRQLPDSDVQEARQGAEDYFDANAATWHGAVARALLEGPGASSAEAQDGWRLIREAQSLGDTNLVNVHLASGLDSAVTILWRFARFGSEQCLTATIVPSGGTSFDDSDC